MKIVEAICTAVLIGSGIGVIVCIPTGKLLARRRVRDSRPVIDVSDIKPDAPYPRA